MKLSLPRQLWRANCTFWRFVMEILILTMGLLTVVYYLYIFAHLTPYDFVIQHKTIWTCLRLTTIGLLWLYWSELMKWFGKKQQWSAEKIQYWKNTRHRFIGWLLIFELLVCENMLSFFLKLL